VCNNNSNNNKYLIKKKKTHLETFVDIKCNRVDAVDKDSNDNIQHFKSINHDGIGIFSSGSTILMKAKMYNIIRAIVDL